jgi:hypothetical protein
MVLSLGIFMDSNVSTCQCRAEKAISQDTKKFIIDDMGVRSFSLRSVYSLAMGWNNRR